VSTWSYLIAACDVCRGFASIAQYFQRRVSIGINIENKPRLAASSYLNSAPLIWSFSNGSRRNEVELIDAVPARCADLLAEGSVDFALVPVIEYQRIPEAMLVPDVCVGSRERVRSVVLTSRLNNLKKIKTVALDESSRTSATLVKIIFKEFLGFEPRWTTTSPDIKQMLRENDAALIIGDPGMSFARQHLHVWDMAALWKENTGLGFVFAMWMALDRAQVAIPDFAAARDEGVTKREEIVSEYVRKIEMPASEIREYLTRNIVFEIDEELQKGMQLYFELAHTHGQIGELKRLEFIKSVNEATHDFG
jgi:chorismate dehydratase